MLGNYGRLPQVLNVVIEPLTYLPLGSDVLTAFSPFGPPLDQVAFQFQS